MNSILLKMISYWNYLIHFFFRTKTEQDVSRCTKYAGLCRLHDCRRGLLGVRPGGGEEHTEGNSSYVQFGNTSWLISITLPFPLNQRRTSGSHHISLLSALCDSPVTPENHRGSDLRGSKGGQMNSPPTPLLTGMPQGNYPDLFLTLRPQQSTATGSTLHQIQRLDVVQ